MAFNDKKITALTPLAPAAPLDVFPIVDVSAIETKKLTIQELFANPQPIGTGTPKSGSFTALRVTVGALINEFSTDGTLIGNSDIALPTEQAVKTYVDNQIAAVASAVINPRTVYSDTTAVAGDVVFVDTTSGDTTSGDITIELIGTPKGRIIVKKITGDLNKVILVPNIGTIDGESQVEIVTIWESFDIVTDTTTFYIV